MKLTNDLRQNDLSINVFNTIWNKHFQSKYSKVTQQIPMRKNSLNDIYSNLDFYKIKYVYKYLDSIF